LPCTTVAAPDPQNGHAGYAIRVHYSAPAAKDVGIGIGIQPIQAVAERPNAPHVDGTRRCEFAQWVRMSGLFADDPRARLLAAAALDEPARLTILDALALTAPYKPWPRGMPTSVNPLLVVVGVSPGNSPRVKGEAFLPNYIPTFATAAPGFWYPDQAHYWEKVRLLSKEIVRIWDPALLEAECLSLTGHLNLGVGMFGSASRDAIELPVVRWVSSVLFKQLQPRIVIGLGLTGLLLGAQGGSIREAWNEGGLAVDWRRPDMMDAGGYRYRRWLANRKDGEPIEIVIWPNHPSRAPFGGAGAPGSRWHDAVVAAKPWITQRVS